MKYIQLLLIFLIFNLTKVYSQTFSSELKLNIASLFVKYPEIGYQYLINDEGAIGIDVAFPIAEERFLDFEYSITPFFRMYPNGNKSGTFYELAFMMYGKKAEGKTYSGIGPSLAIGWKNITQTGFTFEVIAGGGRNFSNEEKILEFFPRLGISVGKRF